MCSSQYVFRTSNWAFTLWYKLSESTAWDESNQSEGKKGIIDMCVSCVYGVFHFSNQAEIARLLLSKGANVNLLNNSMCTALHIAVNKGFTDMVRVLTEHSADVNLQVRGHREPNTADKPLMWILLLYKPQWQIWSAHHMFLIPYIIIAWINLDYMKHWIISPLLTFMCDKKVKLFWDKWQLN